MNRLSCNVRKCNHNLFGICDMHTIRILSCNNEANNIPRCNSFEKYKISKRVRLIGKTDIYEDRLNNVENKGFQLELPDIYCELTNCKYNECSKCQSRTVMIEGFKAKQYGDTKCTTFLINSNI
ncbi:DUF1540 domain-containing protein [Clostridium chauvoei]|uniref:DUF1540 domain-containing protein n=2 Tax=Clostridium chauvoei TaxID=46867 RepID=A0A1U6JDT5_9CLOT|nr:DUF1540 domain-containing protein [Clostridium chauvoei]ATD55111.1 hypothetical protein BTM20_07605 [Clostridium chauvoei]ATD57216.1 hypothetical protein BTM21_05450 [Clostridium chauvoei]MBX7279456.1 DUF1540 domain-containing protein [Clostridium chauvoei]MBX7282458.1 DUF1540 domain-containing protein [Clostridium chauvoei]MBX7285655.1 DUF1540 domain-containing protein [Clostridium chauvoei]